MNHQLIKSSPNANSSHRQHDTTDGQQIRLYGKNRKKASAGKRSYWTDIKGWLAGRQNLTGREPIIVNVTSHSPDLDFAGLSPMRLGPVECYRENGKLVTASNLEVAWQYAKVYSHIIDDAGKLVDVRERFLTVDAQGNPAPSAEWFRWRDAAYTNPRFVHTHPDYKASKKFVRRAFPKGSKVAGWYWDGKLLNAVEARLKIYAAWYQRLVTPTTGFKRLRQIIKRGDDLVLYDLDGYDWRSLGKSPAECIQDLDHSFGHGMVLAFLLQNIQPATLKIQNN